MLPARLSETLDRIDTLSFDCYGTLIDWEAGIRTALADLFPGSAFDKELFDAYLQLEATIEGAGYRPYRDILYAVQTRLAERFSPDSAPPDRNVLAESLPHWQPFPDTNDALTKLKTRFRLGVVSNIDRDLLAATTRSLSVAFDFAITAEDVHAYKPAHAHFLRLVEEAGNHRGSILHVAQSLYHDGVPARQLGLPFVWINRRGEANTTDAEPVAAFPDLATFADAAVV